MDEDAAKNSGGSDPAIWLVVAGCIVLSAAIAIPNFVRARTTSAQNACINNLRQIDGAKDQWAIENRRKTGEIVNSNEVLTYMKRPPVCPGGGIYSFNPVGTNPTCSIGGSGHSLP